MSELRNDLVQRCTADGSFSLWSERFQEGFHSARGAKREAAETFVEPSELDRFCPGSSLRLLEVCVGTGSNTAALLEACRERQLTLQWWGLELDPAPLRLAMADGGFRSQWQPQAVQHLEQLSQGGAWSTELGKGRMLWGDARQCLPELLDEACGDMDLVWHDAFSPRRCPQLWTVEFLAGMARLLKPTGRWISFSSAAAVRSALQLAGLELAAIPSPSPCQERILHQAASWSGGTVASPTPLRPAPRRRPRSTMEHEHQASSAGLPYRDPQGTAEAGLIRENRNKAQAASLAEGNRTASSAWRRQWNVQRLGGP